VGMLTLGGVCVCVAEASHEYESLVSMQGMYKRGWAGHTSDRAFSAAMMAYLQGYDEAQTRKKFAFLELGRSKVDTVRRSPPHIPSPLPPSPCRRASEKLDAGGRVESRNTTLCTAQELRAKSQSAGGALEGAALDMPSSSSETGVALAGAWRRWSRT